MHISVYYIVPSECFEKINFFFFFFFFTAANETHICVSRELDAKSQAF